MVFILFFHIVLSIRHPDPADSNQDGIVDGEEAAAYISPYEQMVIDAGYGTIVDFGDGDYGVLTHGDGLVNGQTGSEYLRAYLSSMGLAPTNVSGCWIRASNDWYWYVANDVYEIDSSYLLEGGEIIFE